MRRAVDIMGAEPNVKPLGDFKSVGALCMSQCPAHNYRAPCFPIAQATYGMALVHPGLDQHCVWVADDFPSIHLSREIGYAPSFARVNENPHASASQSSSRRSLQEIAWVEFIQAASPNLPILLVTVEAGRA